MKGDIGKMEEMIEGDRERSGMPRDRSRSADPDVDEDAFAPC